jgi:hypothetical protein
VDGLSTTVAAAAAGLIIWRAGKNRQNPAKKMPTNDVAAGLLRAAGDALLRRDPDTAWHILADPAIDWPYVAAAVEAYPHFPQGAQLAEMIRRDPAAFIDRLRAVGTAAAGSTVRILLQAVTDVSAVLAQPDDPTDAPTPAA